MIGVVIENIKNEDLYIDFGGKFHCVCKKPDDDFNYARGCLVRILLKDPEMANKFMINTKGISLNEADAILLGPYQGKFYNPKFDRSEQEYPNVSTLWKLL